MNSGLLFRCPTLYHLSHRVDLDGFLWKEVNEAGPMSRMINSSGGESIERNVKSWKAIQSLNA